jgi:hypothetical protein
MTMKAESMTQTASAHALTVTNPWSLVPPLGHLDAYISAVNRLCSRTMRNSVMPTNGATIKTWKPLVNW